MLQESKNLWPMHVISFTFQHPELIPPMVGIWIDTCGLSKDISVSLKDEVKFCILFFLLLRVDFKIACLVFKSLNNLSPSYIQDLIEIYKPTRTLRSSASISLKAPIPPNAFVGRAFSFNAPKIWNNLSHGTRSCTSLQSFKKCLKTEFFKSYFI